MAVGDVIYGQYGLTKIDSYSSSTMASEILVDIQDTSENNAVVMIVGSVQSDVNSWRLIGGFADSSGNILATSYRLLAQGTTSTVYNDSSTTPLFNGFLAVNDNYTAYDPIVASGNVGMVEFVVTLTLERSTSAPIRRPTAFIKSSHMNTSDLFGGLFIGASCKSTTLPTQFKFYNEATNGNVTGFIDVYSLCANT